MSAIDPKFRQINNFQADKPAQLEQNLGRLEDDVDLALKRVAAGTAPLFDPTNLKQSAYLAALDELVECAGTFRVTLPVATPANAGRHVGVENKSGTQTVAPVTGLVNGSATYSCATVGFFDFVSNGVGWTVAPAGGGVAGVTSVTAGNATLAIAPNVGAVVAQVGVITSANVDTSIITSVGAGAGLVDSGTAGHPVLDAVAANATIVVNPDSIQVGVIGSANVDTSIATTSDTKRLRLALQHIRLLLTQLVELEMTG